MIYDPFQSVTYGIFSIVLLGEIFVRITVSRD